LITTISKCLTVFIAAASLLFLGFAIITKASGRNWQGDVDDLSKFTFEKSEGPPTAWSVKLRAGSETVSVPHQMSVPASAVIAARTRLKKIQTERIDQLRRQVSTARDKLSSTKKLIEIDLKAIDKRLQQLKSDLTALNENISAQTIAGTEVAEQISTVQADTEKRREEVFRLQAQLKEIRADKFRAVVQQKRLTELLVRVSGSIQRLQRRNKQLTARLKKPYEKPQPAEADAN
jgi:chromosome segregation ATPase